MKFAVIGAGPIGTTTLDSKPSLVPGVIDLLNSNEYLDFNQPVIKDTLDFLDSISQEKHFICKGKHQYREVNMKDGDKRWSNWICQCGLKIN